MILRGFRIATEIAIVVSAAAATLISILLTGTIGLVPHTVSNGRIINAEFNKAAAFVDLRISSSGNLPTKAEFQEWRTDKGRWVSRMELSKPSKTDEDLMKRFAEVQSARYVLSVWRGEWSEYYVQGKGSSVAAPENLYVSSIGVALGAWGVSAALWWLARRIKKYNVVVEAA